MMKIVISSIIIVSTILLGTIWFDIKQDKEHVLIVNKDSTVYDDWKCGYTCNAQKFKVFEGQKYDVLRIRYGKDFMALKIESKNGLLGWAILTENYELAKSGRT